MIIMTLKLAIIGYSAMTREIIPRLDEEYDIFVNDNYLPIVKEQYPDIVFYQLSTFNPQQYKALVTIGCPIKRKEIVESLPPNTVYHTFIDKTVQIFDPTTVVIGCGSIICANTILTTNIRIGMHSHINLANTICHDNTMGDYFTTAPGVNLSGTCIIGNNVYIGTNSSVKQKITICNNVVIGMNSGVNKNIIKSGTYVGSPIRFLNENTKVF
jgi:sugar O-acyltransferase (sialic acid O-acetyltransferase NeuD family)